MKANFFCVSFFVLGLVASVLSFGQSTPVRPGNWAIKVEACQLENLYKLNDSIYRSEQPDEAEFACLAKLGIKSVLNLRSFHQDSGLMKGLPVKDFTVEMRAAHFTDQEIIESLSILASGPKPVLVHCLHGSDRTGVVIALYRIIFEKWTREQALDELLNGGYGFHKQYDNIVDYIKNADIEFLEKRLQDKDFK